MSSYPSGGGFVRLVLILGILTSSGSMPGMYLAGQLGRLSFMNGRGHRSLRTTTWPL